MLKVEKNKKIKNKHYLFFGRGGLRQVQAGDDEMRILFRWPNINRVSLIDHSLSF